MRIDVPKFPFALIVSLIIGVVFALSPASSSAVVIDDATVDEWAESGETESTSGTTTTYSVADLLDNGLNSYRTFNLSAADTTNADAIWGGTSYNLTGAGVVVGIWDGGDVRSTHQELTGRVTVVDSVGVSGHATHVAGTIGATGVDSSARGMASGVTIRSRDFENDVVEMAADAALINISNHSYGFTRGWAGTVSTSVGSRDLWYADASLSMVEDADFGRYDDTSVEIDALLCDNPHLLSVWSAGNDRNDSFADTGGAGEWVAYFSVAPTTYVSYEGSGTAGDPGWYVVSEADGYTAPGKDGNGGTGYDSLSNGGQTAKNTLVVGAIYAQLTDPQNGSTVIITGFSSYGGTDDGRLGVDVVADGAGLYSSYSTSDSSYATMSGTSMAAPNVTGTAALLHEHYTNLAGGTTVLSATQKGYIIHTATDVTAAAAAGQVGPDYATGYGIVNAEAAADFITAALTDPIATRSDHLLELTLTDGVTFSLDDMVATGDEIKVTLVWTDPEGTAQTGLDDRTSVLVNDLDLWIVDESATTYFPWTLDIEDPSAAAVQTEANHVDNVEQVLISSTVADDTYSVYVGQTGSLLSGLSQDYTLLISGLMYATGGPTADVPEPSTLVALLSMLAVGLVLRRRRSKQA